MAYKGFDKQRIYDLYQQLQSDTAVAKQVGCSVVYAARVMQQFGRPKTRRGGQRNNKARANANTIIDHIVERGGTIKTAQAALNLKVCDALIYEEAKNRNINIGDYRYYRKSAGVLSVDKPRGFYRENSQTFIPATCSHCGVTSDVTYAQLFYAKKPKCPHCGAR